MSMKTLAERGIAEIAAKAGWVANDTKQWWEYPVWDLNGVVIATRTKAYDSKAEKKYTWLPSKPENPESDWYIPPGTKEAIAAAGSVCYLANGEASVLAMKAAGIHNVIATCHGENTVPKNTEAVCKALRIATLINIPDKDKAGLNAAIKWRDALLTSDIEYLAKQWPDYLPEKSDFNDLWVHVGFDAQKAQKALNECATLILPQPAPKPLPKLAILPDFTEGKAKLVSALYEEMNRANLLERHIYKGGWHQCHCPFHEDKKASAGFNIESGVLHCMGECGKGFSPKALAEKLGVNWRGFFQGEGRKTAKKADLSRFQAVLEEIPSQSFERIVLEEMNLRAFIYEQRQFVGFGQWKSLPLGILSAIMTLCNGRSHTALFIGRLMDALLSGELPTVFNREMAVKAVRMPYNAVSRGLFEAECLSFLQKLSGLLFSIDSMPSKETEKNLEGRPCDWFMVELDKDVIISRLESMLEIYCLERVSRKAVAIPTSDLAGFIGLTRAEYHTWLEKAKLALEDPVNKAAKLAYDNEMLGSAGTWKGWRRALRSCYGMPLNYFACNSSLELRAAIASYWVNCLGRNVNSREEWARLLGCTDPVIDKVLEKANLKSLPQRRKLELNFSNREAVMSWENEKGEELTSTETFMRPETVHGMANLLANIQAKHKGSIWKVNFLVSGETGWQVGDMQTFRRDFARYNGRILRVFLLMNLPSKQVPMTEAEIAKRDEKQHQETVASEASTTPKTEAEKVETKPRSVPAIDKHDYEYAKWDTHTFLFGYLQLRNFVHAYTPHELKELRIVDKKGALVIEGELISLWRWALNNASAKPQRRMKSLFGKADYEDDMDELEVFAAEQLKRMEKLEMQAFEAIDESEDVSQLAIFSMFR